jgi:hypothetical protein
MKENEKSRKYTRIVFKSVSLVRVLDKLREHYKEQHQPESLVIPYVLTCAAYLESKLNDELLHFTMKRYGEEVASAFISLSLPRKLVILVPVMTEGHYRINTNHFVYQRLISLIRVRNDITHAKSRIEEITATPEELISVPAIPFEIIQIPIQFMSEPDITLGALKTFSPLQYHEALEKLEKWFFQRCPDKLSKVAMVVDRSKEGQWEEASSTMVKFID